MTAQRSQRVLKPIKAKGYRIEEDGASWGYGDLGYTVGGGMRVVVEGPRDRRISEKSIQRRLERLIRDHINEIVDTDV